METKKDLRARIAELEKREKFLVNRLCPNGKHDFEVTWKAELPWDPQTVTLGLYCRRCDSFFAYQKPKEEVERFLETGVFDTEDST